LFNGQDGNCDVTDITADEGSPKQYL